MHRLNSQRLFLLLGWVVCIFGMGLAHAKSDSHSHYSTLRENLRGAIDLSSRVVTASGDSFSVQALGLDVHKVFSSERGDIGTLVFQPYLLRIDNARSAGGIFDDGDDVALQWRIANFNYTGLAQGRFNLRVGHFEVPFGLEQIVQTNGTLYQMNSPRSLGIKADWGASINGTLPQFEYEFAFLQGGGNSTTTDANGYLAGRIATPRERGAWVGLSWLDGEVEAPGALVERSRWGVDAGASLGRGFSLMAEIADGQDDNVDVRHGMLEVGWWSPMETTFTYLQWRHSERELASDQVTRLATAGLRYEPGRRWSASVEVTHNRDLDRPYGFAGQLRYRFEG